MRRLTLIGVALPALLVAASCSLPDAQAERASARFSPYVDANGNISRPQNFQTQWVHLGTWFVEDDEVAKGAGVYDVYTQRETLNAFQQNGQWPDGAVLVKTVSGINKKRMTTGNVRWAGDIGVWFVMVRDREHRFPDNPAWGGGWGWALFKADAPMKNTTVTWKGEGFNNCFGCHLPAKDTEWVYINGYPSIRDYAKYGQ